MEKNKNDNKLNLSSVNSCGGRRKPVTWSATFFLDYFVLAKEQELCSETTVHKTVTKLVICYYLGDHPISRWQQKSTFFKHLQMIAWLILDIIAVYSLQLFKDFSFQRHVYTYCLKDNKVPYCPYRSLCFQGAGLFVDLRGSKSRVGGRAIKRQTPSIHLRLGFKLSSLMKLFTFARSGNPGTFLNYAATGLMC